MFYTISKGLLWYLLALLLGFVIGYLIRSAMCNRQVARAKADRSDDAELERLRGRVANLEPVVAERDRLRDELEACRNDLKTGVAGGAGLGVAGGAVAGSLAGGLSGDGGGELDAPGLSADLADAEVTEIDVVEVDVPGAGLSGVTEVDVVEVDVPAGADVDGVDVIEVDVPEGGVSGAALVDGPEVEVDETDVVVDGGLGAPSVAGDGSGSSGDGSGSSGDGSGSSGDGSGSSGDGAGSGGDTPSVQGFASTETDVSGAAAVLGKKIKADDLTVVEGIGPAISKLCNGIGIHTWAELASTETSLLRTMLHDAGPRFQMHDPGTWPEQAGLLAEGRWEDFKRLTDQLDGGRRI